jgi:1,2-diacylglycerol-3-alpha-glucose alpha-1,2-galactosyltransferase
VSRASGAGVDKDRMHRLDRPLRINVVSETGALGLTQQGGHTGFVDCAEILATHPDLDVRVNHLGPCDVVHSHSWGPSYPFHAWRMAGRRVFTAHVIPETAEGSLPFATALQPVIRGWLRWIFDWSDVIVSVGPAETAAIRALGVRTRIETVPNPIRRERFQPSIALRAAGRRMLGLLGDRRIVLGVGQIQPRKGIDSFAAVAERLPEIEFVWVGGRPFGRATAGRGETNRIMRDPPRNLSFAGMFPIEQMPALYNAADVFLFPSHQENCPYAPLEAAACGVPIVLRDLPEYRALYAEPMLYAADDDAMAVHVATLLTSRATRTRWSDAALRLANAFSVDGYRDRMAAIYGALCAGDVPEARPRHPDAWSSAEAQLRI